jgi:hypothetical protein
VSGKLDELRSSLNSKLTAQEEAFTQKLKKIEEEQLKRDPKKSKK